MIELNNVSKSYDRKVLDNVNLSFASCGLVSILGDSGSGKSTLLNILAGIEFADSGMVSFGLRDIKEINANYYSNSLVGYIFQSYNLIDYLTVLDNVLLGVNLSHKVVGNVDDILKKLNIYHLKYKKVKYLSGGEKQRVAIARCLVCDYKVILADEPTGALDNFNSLNVLNILKEISRDRLVIMVTHNEDLAKKYSDIVYVLNDGKLSLNSGSLIDSRFDVNLNEYNPRLRIRDRLKISLGNLNKKKIRFFLTVIAFMIGLFGFGFILAINSGFSEEIDNLKEEVLFDFPLIINKYNYLDGVNKESVDVGGYNVRESNMVINELDNKFFSLIDGFDANKVYYKDIDKRFLDISYVIPSLDYFEVVSGRLPSNEKEVLILLDDEQSISEDVLTFLNVNNYDLINKSFRVDGVSFKVVGIVKSNHNYFMTLNGILYYSTVFDSDVLGVHIYPKDYASKLEIKNALSDYYIDDSMDYAVEVVSKLMDGITLVLLLFSFISMFITSIMIVVISYISVIEREREIGIFKSIGMTNKDIKKMFLFDNYVIGFVSSFVSIILLIVVGNYFNDYVSSNINIDNMFSLNGEIIVGILLLSFILSYLSGIVPARIGAKKKIIDIIRG